MFLLDPRQQKTLDPPEIKENKNCHYEAKTTGEEFFTTTFASVCVVIPTVLFTSRRNHGELLSSDPEAVLPKTLNPFQMLPLANLINPALRSSSSPRNHRTVSLRFSSGFHFSISQMVHSLDSTRRHDYAEEEEKYDWTGAGFDSMVSVRSEVYVIGGPIDGAPAPAVRILDCRTHTWRNGPRMIVSRKDAAVCVHDGKIYVLGGCINLKKGEPWAEVFDPKTQIWECLPDPGTEIAKHNFDKIYEIEGKLIFRGEKCGTYAFHPKGYKWERCEYIGAMSELVVGNVTFVFSFSFERFELWWSSVKSISWREVKGLESLVDKYMSNGGGSRNHKLVWCGGKLYLIWDAVKRDHKKIWCAEILLEKRRASEESGGWGQFEERSEFWGEVKWIDVVHTMPISCQLLQCLPVTV